MGYTKEQTDLLITEYVKNKEDEEIVDKLAEMLDRSPRSIIGKLVRENVYEKKTYRSKNGELPITKKEIIANMCDLLGANPEKVSSFEKAGKRELQYFYGVLKEKIPSE